VTFILASTSRSRARLLAAAQVPFTAIRPAVDEDAAKEALLRRGQGPRAIASALAEAKALAISEGMPGALVLGADQVMEFETKLVNKSADLAEARRQLLALRGKVHHLHTAAVLAEAGQAVWLYASSARLCMRAFSSHFLDDYLAREGEASLAGVGCYRLEGMGAQLFETVEGDYFSILGLPLLPLLAELRQRGVIAT
jgi:septum formation protein